MPYVLVRESFINSYCSVEGLPLNEGKILGKTDESFLFNILSHPSYLGTRHIARLPNNVKNNFLSFENVMLILKNFN